MNFTDRIVKIGSIIFMTFITMIIVFAFGMPNFLGTSGQAEGEIFARVDGEIISRRELMRAKSRVADYYKQRGFPQKMMEQYSGTFLSQAGTQLINQKILERIIKGGGFQIITDKKKAEIFHDYLKRNWPKYVKKGNFDFNLFEKEILKDTSVYENILNDALSRYQGEKFERILNLIPSNNPLEALEELRMKQTLISYKILLINSDTKQKILKKSSYFK